MICDTSLKTSGNHFLIATAGPRNRRSEVLLHHIPWEKHPRRKQLPWSWIDWNPNLGDHPQNCKWFTNLVRKFPIFVGYPIHHRIIMVINYRCYMKATTVGSLDPRLLSGLKVWFQPLPCRLVKILLKFGHHVAWEFHLTQCSRSQKKTKTIIVSHTLSMGDLQDPKMEVL